MMSWKEEIFKCSELKGTSNEDIVILKEEHGEGKVYTKASGTVGFQVPMRESIGGLKGRKRRRRVNVNTVYLCLRHA